MPVKQQRGFTLVELISVLVIVGILAGVVASRAIPNTTLQLQAGRDVFISALFVAQQKAMSQADDIRLITSAGLVDIRQDSNNNGTFESSESIRQAGTSYPVSMPGGVSLSVAQIDYDRLGRTSATTISVSKGGENVTVTVSGTGYAY